MKRHSISVLGRIAMRAIVSLALLPMCCLAGCTTSPAPEPTTDFPAVPTPSETPDPTRTLNDLVSEVSSEGSLVLDQRILTSSTTFNVNLVEGQTGIGFYLMCGPGTSGWEVDYGNEDDLSLWMSTSDCSSGTTYSAPNFDLPDPGAASIAIRVDAAEMSFIAIVVSTYEG